MDGSPAHFAQLVGVGQHERRLSVPARADKPHVDPIARTAREQPELIRTVDEHLPRDRSVERKRRPLATRWCHESEPTGTTNPNQCRMPLLAARTAARPARALVLGESLTRDHDKPELPAKRGRALLSATSARSCGIWSASLSAPGSITIGRGPRMTTMTQLGNGRSATSSQSGNRMWSCASSVLLPRASRASAPARESGGPLGVVIASGFIRPRAVLPRPRRRARGCSLGRVRRSS